MSDRGDRSIRCPSCNREVVLKLDDEGCPRCGDNFVRMLRVADERIAELEANYYRECEAMKNACQEIARQKQHLADARVRVTALEVNNAEMRGVIKRLERQVGEWRGKLAKNNKEWFEKYQPKCAENRRYRAAIEAALERDAKSAYLPPDIEDKLRDALGEGAE